LFEMHIKNVTSVKLKEDLQIEILKSKEV